MIKKILIAILFMPSIFAVASPEKDYDEFVSYFENRFPDTPFEDYKNGVYSMTNLQESNGKLWKNFHHMNSMLIEAKNYLTDLLKTVILMGHALRTLV